MDAGICCMSAGTGGRVELRVLGAVELRTAGGRLVPLPGPRLRAVLGVLALHANRVVATERLLENVWGQAPPKTARNSLQGHVSRLRRLLAASGEATTAGGRSPPATPSRPPRCCAPRWGCGGARCWRARAWQDCASSSPPWRSAGWRRWRTA